MVMKTKKRRTLVLHFYLDGEPGVTRTRGPLLRRQMLYPTELQAQTSLIILSHCNGDFNPFLRFYCSTLQIPIKYNNFKKREA